MEFGLSEALELGQQYIGPEHILLGLVRVTDGVAARVLLDFDVDTSKVRYELLRTRTGSTREAGATTELVVTCPACATPLEPITAQHPIGKSEVSEDGIRGCAGCGREWTISYAVAWRPSVTD